MGDRIQEDQAVRDASNASIWLLIFAALLIGFCTGYTVPRWLQDDTLQVVELDRRTAENLIKNVRCER